MNILITIITVVAIIIAILLIIALFIPNEYKIVRETVVNRPRGQVFNYIKLLKNQDNYNKWIMLDPHMDKTFDGTDGEEGFIYAWDSKNTNAGKGEQEITKITEGDRIDIEIRFLKPFESVGKVFMASEFLSDDQTFVKWGMEGKNKYPFNLMNLMMHRILGKDLEVSLSNLKNILEKEGNVAVSLQE